MNLKITLPDTNFCNGCPCFGHRLTSIGLNICRAHYQNMDETYYPYNDKSVMEEHRLQNIGSKRPQKCVEDNGL